jgi:hypothetical protein
VLVEELTQIADANGRQMMERRRKPAKTIKDIFEPSNYYPVTSRYSQLVGL